MKKIMLLIIFVFYSVTGSLLAESLVEKGKSAFDENGCSGCHKVGSDWNGPDLSSVTTYRSREWIIDFTLQTKKYYDDPIIKEWITKYNQYMPDQGVERKDAELIYEYLKSLSPGKKEGVK